MAGEVLAIEARKTQAESSARAGARPKEEEEKEGDGTVSQPPSWPMNGLPPHLPS